MPADIKIYKDLLGLLLGPIKERPGMFLGKPEISKLQTYIVGYDMGFQMTGRDPIIEDRYFNPGFINWFYKKYKIRETSFWETPFLEQAKNDERIALELFFQYLEEYSKSLTEKGSV